MALAQSLLAAAILASPETEARTGGTQKSKIPLPCMETLGMLLLSLSLLLPMPCTGWWVMGARVVSGFQVFRPSTS